MLVAHTVIHIVHRSSVITYRPIILLKFSQSYTELHISVACNLHSVSLVFRWATEQPRHSSTKALH